jgi:spore coat protein U-like protein
MKQLLFFIMLALSFSLSAAPFVQSEATTQAVTSCLVTLDSAAPVTAPIVDVTGGKACKLDLSGIGFGSHTLTAKYVITDAIWGNAESPLSAPFTFIKPDLTIQPPNGWFLLPL